MTYEITVSKQGKHIFATREYSYTDAKTAYLEISRKFTIAGGYLVSVTEWTRTGRQYSNKNNSTATLFSLQAD